MCNQVNVLRNFHVNFCITTLPNLNLTSIYIYTYIYIGNRLLPTEYCLLDIHKLNHIKYCINAVVTDFNYELSDTLIAFIWYCFRNMGKIVFVPNGLS
jgi:hypothetical protein